MSQDLQSTPSALLVHQQEYDFILKFEQIYNIKDKTLGKSVKSIAEIASNSQVFKSSATLINYLNNDRADAYVTQYQQSNATKNLHYDIKTFDTCEVIDAILDNSNLPKYDVLHDECISNFNTSCAKIFDSVNAKCQLVQLS